MSLYLCPPTGTVAIDKLEEYARKRLLFLVRLVACCGEQEMDEVLEDVLVVENSDCLITNTHKDNISHHILRLTIGGDPEVMSFFCEAELALFKLRVERMLVDEWIVFFKSTDRFLCKLKGKVSATHCSSLSDLMLVFDVLKEKFESWHHVSSEIFSGKKTNDVSVNIPFQVVLRLVGGRHVDVSKGMAKVPVALLREVLIEQFDKLLVTATKRASLERELALGDERIRRLTASLKSTLRAETKMPKYHPDNFPALRLSDLWLNSYMFPPCMANIVKVLQEQHRLKHHDRVQLTLFLKELGLPVNDALLLWKREYSVPTNPSSNGHGWQGNERKYIYNIRHLYGLEGCRTDYRAHTCSAIQGRALSCGHAGGCPFICQDSSALESICNDQGIDKGNIDHIIKLCNQKQYGVACQKLMIHKLEKIYKNQEIVLESGKESTKTIVGDSHQKPAAILDNCVRIDACYNEIPRKKESFVMGLDLLNYDDKILLYGQINNSTIKSELKCDASVSYMREMADNQIIQREIMNLGESLPIIDFKRSGNSEFSSDNSDLSANVCRVCQKLIFKTIINSSGSFINSSDDLSDRHITFTSPVNTDSSKLKRTHDSFKTNQNNTFTCLVSNLNSGEKVSMQENKNIYQDLDRNKLADNSMSTPPRINSLWKCRNEADIDNKNIRTENSRFGHNRNGNLINNNKNKPIYVTQFQIQDGPKPLSTDLAKLNSDCTAPSSGIPPIVNETSSESYCRDNKIYKPKRYLFKIQNKTRIATPQKRMYWKIDTSDTIHQAVSDEHKVFCPDTQSLKRGKYMLSIKQTELVSRMGSSQQKLFFGNFKSCSKGEHCNFCCFKTGVDQVKLSSNSVSNVRCSESATFYEAPPSSVDKIKICCFKTGIDQVKLSSNSVSNVRCSESATFYGTPHSSVDKIKNESSTFNAVINCSRKSYQENYVLELLDGGGRLSCCAEGGEYSDRLSHCSEVNGSSSKLSDHSETNGLFSKLSDHSEANGLFSKLSDHSETNGFLSKLSDHSEVNGLFSKLSHCAKVNGLSKTLSTCSKNIAHSSKLSGYAEINGHSSKLSDYAELNGYFSTLSHCADSSGHSPLNFHQQEREGTERLNIGHTLQAIEHPYEGMSPGPTENIPRSGACWEHSVCSLCKCLKCCIKEEPQPKLPFGSENPVVIQKPRDIYWFCREHHK